MRLTKKQKKFLLEILDRSYMPACVEGNFSGEGTGLPDNPTKQQQKEAERNFRKQYGISRKVGLRYWDKFISELTRDVSK